MHFLIRGNVTRAASGYKVEMLVVDAATERVLGTKSLTLAAGALTPRRREHSIRTGGLTFNALTAEVERARNKPIESWTYATRRFAPMSIGAARSRRRTKRAPMSPPRIC
ncbi:MAG: hypothetical protein IPI87_04440 [Betaproteobacteria bacterium]|nr:hypothetical protein [Betaproteobacteria bacterium]